MSTLKLDSTLGSSLPEGYTVRPMRMEDVPAITAMLNTESRQLIGVEKYNERDVSNDWGWGGADQEKNSRVLLAPDGELVGYEGFWVEHTPHGMLYLWGRVHPAHTGRGLASHLLAWVEQRAQEYLPQVPPGIPARLVLTIPDIHQAGKQVVLDHGYQPVRHYFRMVIDLNELPAPPVWPEGIQVRTYQPGEDDWPTMRLIRDAFRDHWGVVETDETVSMEGWRKMRLEDPEFDPTLYFLALDGDQMVGASLCWPRLPDDPRMGYIQTLGVRRDWRKRGLGEALLRHSFQEFYHRGQARAGLIVDADSLTNAVRLYEKAGMRSDPVRLMTRFEKELCSARKEE